MAADIILIFGYAHISFSDEIAILMFACLGLVKQTGRG